MSNGLIPSDRVKEGVHQAEDAGAGQSQAQDNYAANPNQKVYDQQQQTDFKVDVLEIYFAEKEYKWESKEEEYIVKGSGKVSDVKKKFEKENRRNIKADPDHGNDLKKDDKIKITWEERVDSDFTYKKINKARVKNKIYVVAKCAGDKGTLTINIQENKLSAAEQIYENPVKFLDGETEQTKVEFKIDGTITYAKEITLRPKSDDDLKKLSENFEKRDNKTAFLYLKAEVAGTDDEIVFPDDTHEFINKDGDRLEVKFCDCGIRYRDDVTCTRYNTTYGPVYWGELPLADFPKWDDLVKSNTVTADEKTILIAMSENEGKLDAVQSYDSEILTAGAMQKTINPDGYGELPIQLWEFKSQFPEKYECYLKNCKWEIEEEVIETKDKAGKVTTKKKYKAKYDGETGASLKSRIRNGFNSGNFKQKVKSEPVEPIIKLMKDEDFQAKQIKDFITRLHDALGKTPTGYSGNTIGDFVASNLGKATVLDHDVNRPGHVKDCFGEALDSFFKANPKVSKAPGDWGENAAAYEKDILEIYGPLRGTGSYTMTNASKRYTSLKSKL